MASGNSWTFATGGKMVDMGSSVLQCTCPANGLTMERIALYAPGSSTIGSSFFFMKNTPTGGTQLTNMVGVENDAYANNVTIASSTTFPYGIPIMDDSPKQNESWSDGAGGISAITSVGVTLPLSGTTQVVNVATNQLSSPTTSTITWSFAKGVGFAQIGVGSQTTTIATFSVNATSSTSYAISTESVRPFYGHTGRIDVSSLSALFR